MSDETMKSGGGAGGNGPMYSGGGGGATYVSYGGSAAQRQPTENETRLLLQYVRDHGGSVQSYPSAVSDALMPAVQAGWLDDGFTERMAAIRSDGSAGGCGGSGGVTTFRLTESGRTELERLTNASPNPTRLVYGTRNIPFVGNTIYGGPIEQPLNAGTRVVDGFLARK